MDMNFYVYMFVLNCIYLEACYSQTCPTQNIESHYGRLSSISIDPIRHNYAKIVVDNCLFGKEQFLVNSNHCFKHCYLLDNCVAIYMSNDENCRLCYNGTGTTNYEDFNHDNVFIRLEVLGKCPILKSE